MIHSCSTGELLTKTAFMHYADKGHNTLKYYVALKGLLLIYAYRGELVLALIFAYLA